MRIETGTLVIACIGQAARGVVGEIESTGSDSARAIAARIGRQQRVAERQRRTGLQAQPPAGVLGEGHVSKCDQPGIMIDDLRTGIPAEGHIGKRQLHL